MLFGYTVDDVGLDGWSSEDHFARILQFCAEQRLNATFFAVPESPAGHPLTRRTGYAKLLREAQKQGCEIAQHGINHDRFEVGIPPDMILNLPHEGPAREFLLNNRAKLAEEHSVVNIRRKLRYGRTILEEILEEKIHGFRAPALQGCDNLFQSLVEEGYLYDSSMTIQETGWDLIMERDEPPRPIDRGSFDRVQRFVSMTELPLTTDYSWLLKPAWYDKVMRLAQHDFSACLNAEIPFIFASHVSPMFNGEGITLLRQFIPWCREAASASGVELKSMTLAEIATELNNTNKVIPS